MSTHGIVIKGLILLTAGTGRGHLQPTPSSCILSSARVHLVLVFFKHQSFADVVQVGCVCVGGVPPDL